MKIDGHVWNALDDKFFLEKLGGYRKDRKTGVEGLTLAGLLMFGTGQAIRERQKQILAYMDAGVEYSTEQVAEKIGLKGPRTRQLLNELVNMELLACIETTKKRRYIKV